MHLHRSITRLHFSASKLTLTTKETNTKTKRDLYIATVTDNAIIWSNCFNVTHHWMKRSLICRPDILSKVRTTIIRFNTLALLTLLSIWTRPSISSDICRSAQSPEVSHRPTNIRCIGRLHNTSAISSRVLSCYTATKMFIKIMSIISQFRRFLVMLFALQQLRDYVVSLVRDAVRFA